MRSPLATNPSAPADVKFAFPFLDPALPRAARIEDLAQRLTLPEKINQLLHENNAIPRLGIPAYNWWNEACHGVGRNGRATVFPQVIGLAATWNRELVRQVASAIADEARAKYHAAIAADRHGQYQGLTFWTPNINIFRDPRWGRGQETFGEDPYLTGELGVEMVRGLQGDNPDQLKVAACAKHYAVHSGPEGERHTFDAQPTPKDLMETYLPAFEKLVRAGVEAVMGAYNRVLGEPACGSRFLIGDILRGRWGFKGHFVSDCGAIDDFHRHHKITPDAAASAALAVRMGCDLNCGCTYNDLLVAVREKLVSIEEIDTSLRRLLATKFKLQMFDPPPPPKAKVQTDDVIASPVHRALARKAAAESIVLLKNEGGLLPLRRDPASVIVAGPTAANVNAMLGNYSGVSSQIVTFLEGIAAQIDANTILEYRAGCPISQQAAPGINYTFGAAGAAEVVIAVLGLDPTLEGEEGDAVGSFSGGDRAEIELPAVQREFLLELRKHSKKLILVVTGGSAIAIPREHEICDAVLYAWYAGCEGGYALADVLFGDVCPTGKLPITVPQRTADLPPFNDYRMQGRTYRFAEIEPLYPFGFGLSYAKIAYGSASADATTLAEGKTLGVEVTVTNSSSVATNETVQCYVIPPRHTPDTPRVVLVDFKKVALAANSSARVKFQLPTDAFRQVDATGARRWQAGNYQIVIGGAAPGARAQTLGAPAPATVSVSVI